MSLLLDQASLRHSIDAEKLVALPKMFSTIPEDRIA